MTAHGIGLIMASWAQTMRNRHLGLGFFFNPYFLFILIYTLQVIYDDMRAHDYQAN